MQTPVIQEPLHPMIWQYTPKNAEVQNLLTWDQAMQLLGKSEPQLQNLLTWD